MDTLSHNRSGNHSPGSIPTSVHFAFWGAVIGVLSGLATLFAISTYYGAISGLESVDCAVFGSVSTLLLSQPVILGGVATGAVCGGACALLVHFLHRSRNSG